MKDNEIVKMGHAIQHYLHTNMLDDLKPKDLMPYLIEKGFFKSDHREGLPLRNVLRSLDASNKLFLLPMVQVERKDQNRYWFFRKLRF